MPDHHKRVALVTGANRGIGYAISHRLGEQDITVILGTRDPNKGAAARLRLQGGSLDVHFELLDVSDDNILINSACPGWVKTDLGGDQAPLTPEQGADTEVWLATLPDGGPTGGFYRERTMIAW